MCGIKNCRNEKLSTDLPPLFATWNELYQHLIKEHSAEALKEIEEVGFRFVIWDEAKGKQVWNYALGQIKANAFDELQAALPEKRELHSIIISIDSAAFDLEALAIKRKLINLKNLAR